MAFSEAIPKGKTKGFLHREAYATSEHFIDSKIQEVKQTAFSQRTRNDRVQNFLLKIKVKENL